jgi:hypothetical protein
MHHLSLAMPVQAWFLKSRYPEHRKLQTRIPQEIDPGLRMLILLLAQQ